MPNEDEIFSSGEYLKIECIKDIAIVSFIGMNSLNMDFESGTAILFGRLLTAIDKLGKKKVIMDIDKMQSLSEYTISRFISFHKKIDEARGAVIFCNLSEGVYEKLVNIMHLDRLFNITEGRKEAIAKLDSISEG